MGQVSSLHPFSSSLILSCHILSAISKLLTSFLPLPNLDTHFHYTFLIFDFKLMLTEDDDEGIAPSYLTAGILRLYVEDKVVSDVCKVFDEIPQPDVVKWDVLMNGYVKCGLGSDGLDVFREMLARGTEPDKFSATTALTACAQAGALAQGKWIHEFLKKKKKWVESDVFVGTALVDMYAKCGCLEMAMEVFENLSKRNVFSWAALIGGYAAYGYAKKAITCFEKMELQDAIKPDSVVLLAVLSASARGGFLQEGRAIIDNMRAPYGITPKHEHYSCIVDLIC